MNRRFKAVAVLSVACLAISLSASLLFDWHLKRADDQLKKQLKSLTAADDRPSLHEVKVPTPEDLLFALETPDRFRVTYRVSDIPNGVKLAFAKATQNSTQEDAFSMAEPGTWPWNVSDVILHGLPAAA